MERKSKKSIPGLNSLLNNWLLSSEIRVLYLLLFITFVFSLLYFNVGIDIGGDDAAYLLRAKRLWERGEVPGFQGVLYPVLLAPFYGLTGGRLFWLRLLSVPMFLGSICFLYRTFRAGFKPFTFFVLLLTLSISYYWLRYASLTYSEALFNLIQFGLLYFFYRRFTREQIAFRDILLLSVLALALMKTRASGAAVYPAVVFFLLLQKRWKDLLHFTWISVLLVFSWDLLWNVLQPANNSAFASQLSGLFQKNPYDTSQGSADLALLFKRFFHNFNSYVSKHVMQALALRSYGAVKENLFFTLAGVLFFIAAFFKNRSREPIIIFSQIYLFLSLAVVLLTPEMWDQSRFIQPLIPLIFILVVYEIRQFFSQKMTWMPGLLVSLLFILQLIPAAHFAGENRAAQRAYHHGDPYYGQSPDWKNYFRACEWIGKNLNEKEGLVAARKPQIATLVSGKDIFFGIHTVESYRASAMRSKLEDSREHFTAIDIEKFFRYQVPQQIADALAQSYAGVIMKDSELSGLQLFNIQDQAVYQKIVEVNNQLQYIVPLSSLVDDRNNFSIAFADSLLQNLERNGVAYLLLGNLRVYRERQTDEVLSAVHNYMTAIRIRYPDIFEQVYQAGPETGEPATVFRIRYVSNQEKPAQAVVPEKAPVPDAYGEICEYALKISESGSLIACSRLPGQETMQAGTRFINLTEAPLMDYRQFMELMEAGKNRFLLLDAAGFDINRVEQDLVPVLSNSFHGLVYIGSAMYRLHRIDSPELYSKIAGNSYVSGYVVGIERLRELPVSGRQSFQAFEPAYMLAELKKKNIRYIIEDQSAGDLNQNIPMKLVFLIGRVYPDALQKIKETGGDKAPVITLYRVKYDQP
ncbi:MAG: ArnT family glycosyltransferase [Bacteroidota bacterium]